MIDLYLAAGFVVLLVVVIYILMKSVFKVMR